MALSPLLSAGVTGLVASTVYRRVGVTLWTRTQIIPTFQLLALPTPGPLVVQGWRHGLQVGWVDAKRARATTSGYMVNLPVVGDGLHKEFVTDSMGFQVRLSEDTNMPIATITEASPDPTVSTHRVTHDAR